MSSQSLQHFLAPVLSENCLLNDLPRNDIILKRKRSQSTTEDVRTISVHDGHRARVKRRFIENGTVGMDDYQVLEMLLFYSVPRGDVNPLAHELMNRFGSLSGVLDAPVSALTEVSGVGENTAVLLHMMPQLQQRYLLSRTRVETMITSTDAAGRYLMPYFHGERDEVVFLVCLDAKYKVLSCDKLFQGSVNSAGVSVRKVIECALAHNSANVILAHNHASGIAIPSQADIDTTQRIHTALESVGIRLTDHIIVTDDDFVSMADSGLLTGSVKQ